MDINFFDEFVWICEMIFFVFAGYTAWLKTQHECWDISAAIENVSFGLISTSQYIYWPDQL